MMISYPNQEGSRFDVDYYLNQHMTLVVEKLGARGLITAAVDQGVAGGTPGSKPKYQIQCHLNFSTIEELDAALKAEGAALMADLANFTDVRPEVQVNQVLR